MLFLERCPFRHARLTRSATLLVTLDDRLDSHLFGLEIPPAHFPASQRDETERADAPV